MVITFFRRAGDMAFGAKTQAQKLIGWLDPQKAQQDDGVNFRTRYCTYYINNVRGMRSSNVAHEINSHFLKLDTGFQVLLLPP
jgi:hypothetical protein